MPELDFRAPRLFVDAPLTRGRANRAGAQPEQLSGQRAAALGRRNHPGVQRPRRRMAGADRGPQAARRPEHRRADAAAGSPARHRLCLCAAEARPPRLHGAEGGRDGRLSAAAGVDAAHPGFAGQRRADARQCHRGRRAMRHPEPCRGRRARCARPLSRKARNQSPAGVLRRGGRHRQSRSRRCNRD